MRFDFIAARRLARVQGVAALVGGLGYWISRPTRGLLTKRKISYAKRRSDIELTGKSGKIGAIVIGE